MEIQKSAQKVQKEFEFNDEQRKIMYIHASRLSKDAIDEIAPFLLRIALNSEKGLLKNELGRVIFHLQKNDRLETVIGVQKLLEAALIVAPEEMFKLLKGSGSETQELANKIKEILEE